MSSDKKTSGSEKGWFKKGHKPWNKGKPLPDEVREKVSQGCKRTFQNGRKKSPKAYSFPKGEKHPLWKGGNSRWYKEGYWTPEYHKWRQEVFERDDWTCQTCGNRCSKENPVYLTAHHIKSWARFPESRFDVDNGLTLCSECHKKTDNFKGRQQASNT